MNSDRFDKKGIIRKYFCILLYYTIFLSNQSLSIKGVLSTKTKTKEEIMFKKAILGLVIVSIALLAGCASVPMAPTEQDSALKAFSQPAADKAGLYIFRNTSIGQALRKKVYVDEALLGETANKTYFYKQIAPGQHQVSTESEFGNNTITFQAEGGKNYFARQYIKMGVFVGGANIEMVSEQEGMEEVRKCGLAK
jgi:hypothetical protein